MLAGTKYTDVHVHESRLTARLFQAEVKATATEPDGTVHKDCALWYGQDTHFIRLRNMAERARDDILARGHVSRV